jgi:hypothetical protein
MPGLEEQTLEHCADQIEHALGQAQAVPHPEKKALETWAAIETVGGKFPAGWEGMRDAARGWGIQVDGNVNEWLSAIEPLGKQLLDGPMAEDQLVGYLFRVHHLAPTEAKKLPLEKLAELLKNDVTLQEANQADTDAVSAERGRRTAGQVRREPSEDAFKAYRLSLLTGKTQTELAKC